MAALNPTPTPTADELGRIGTLFRLSRWAELELLGLQLAEAYPRDAYVWKTLGVAYRQTGRAEEALAALQQVAALAPHDAEAHFNLGVVLKGLGHVAEAEGAFLRAIALRARFVEALFNLSVLYREQERPTEAEAGYRRILALKPDTPAALLNLGVLLRERDGLAEAEACLRRVLELDPACAEAHLNLGVVLKDGGRPDEAEVHSRRAAAMMPDFAPAHFNLGNVLGDLGRLKEAEGCLLRALELRPQSADTHGNLGMVQQQQGRFAEAEASCRRMLELEPDHESAFGRLLFTLNYDPDKLAEEIFAAYREYDVRFGLPLRATWRAHVNDRTGGRRLKVGYVSPDFRRHPVSHFLEPLLARHDKSVVEVYAYAELAREDEVTARYRGYADHWVATRGLSDEALAERIRADGIDILVDLAGHTGENRLCVFARKPAPVQVSWLGYGYTTGLTAIDYLLTDVASAPAGSESLYAEAPWRLATPGYAYRPAEGMGAVSPLPALERGQVTFGTLTRRVRINHRTVRVWSEILDRVPGSRLVIDSNNFREAAMVAELRERFAEHGIDGGRLQIGYHSPPWDILRQIDIGLDCFPHNSGTTLFESLYMGVPFVTLAGRPTVGRLGSAILQGLGRAEWIAHSEEDYVGKALALAGDLEALARLRAGLRGEMQAGALMDEAGFARKVEAAYREMFGKWTNSPANP